ncbi:hypothetical protein Q4E93_21070 [Flavitalea sp. BT771]|uniref:hypothetical protein n=1 Tax=Flavitalea sp. BT771 TaxID=3063329 RepID=UPI0026E127FE|nr:hypothetical protein [Flavitalea sp. BT771]MDO6433114.1 hypothetical protein [Flavitalea sp. BT771]MDV6221610.1 hypothetical protein [Flavitalea sp. BT771]
MRQYIFSIIILAVLGTGCGKSSEDGQVSIQKKWALVSDSSYSSIGIVYQVGGRAGTLTDYWDFRKDGHVYVKEGTSLDTMAYTLNSPGSITITGFSFSFDGPISACTIKTLTAHEAVIRSDESLSLGTSVLRVLHLRR